MKVTYSSNNSGGSWWLKDKDWINLEKAGWDVVWGGYWFCHSKYSFDKNPNGQGDICPPDEQCQGHKKFNSHKDMAKKDRWLGCLAKYASKDFPSIKDALEEFESITGQNVMDEGCNCCGPPHAFSWDVDGGYCSGADCGEYLFSRRVPTLREAMERMR